MTEVRTMEVSPEQMMEQLLKKVNQLTLNEIVKDAYIRKLESQLAEQSKEPLHE